MTRRAPPGRPSDGRIFTWFVLAGIGLLVAATMYLYLGRAMYYPVIPTEFDPADPVSAAQERRLKALLVLLLAAALLILVFVLGAYLVIRLGRAVTESSVGGKPTRYVDAWSRYRISDEQVTAATREDDAPPGGQGGRGKGDQKDADEDREVERDQDDEDRPDDDHDQDDAHGPGAPRR